MALLILADHHLERQVERLVGLMASGSLAEFWEALGIGLTDFPALGLDPETSDRDLWRRCQRDGLILITANRNHDGPDSLEAVIRGENTPDSLPVFTVSAGDRLTVSREYAERVAEKFLEYLSELDAVRGAGRLYLP